MGRLFEKFSVLHVFRDALQEGERLVEDDRHADLAEILPQRQHRAEIYFGMTRNW